MIFKIYRIKNADNCHNLKTGEAIPYLTYEDPCPPDDPPDDQVVSVGGHDASLEELVGLCDQDAENRNAHDYCGAHRLLGAVLFRKLGRVTATETMLEIAARGGLHRMNGVCCRTDSYRELNIGKNGYDWGGKYR